jgi:hypothetical protein
MPLALMALAILIAAGAASIVMVRIRRRAG